MYKTYKTSDKTDFCLPEHLSSKGRAFGGLSPASSILE